MRENGFAAMGWLFAAFALLVGWMGVDPRRRRMLRWGRTASSVPMSGFGVSAWIGAFLVTAAAAFGLLPFIVVFGVVPGLAVAGCIDSRRAAGKPPRS